MDYDFSCEDYRKYRVDLPYPDVIITHKNTHNAQFISGAYAGRGSEMTAISQYTFHHFYNGEYPAVFNAYKYITYVETIHLRLLGGLIQQLGLIPKFVNYETGMYWNGSYPNYSTNLKAILAADLQGEHDAVAHYKRLIDLIPNESITSLFRRIILDEEMHIKILTGFINTYG